MNAMFPGSHHGHTIEYMAAEVIEDLKGSDFCIDIHSSDIFIRELPRDTSAGECREKSDRACAKVRNPSFMDEQ